MPRIDYTLDERELDFSAVRAQGAGGQNVNKVSNAAVLRFDIAASTLPAALKARLVAQRDHRIGAGGVVTIKAQEHRSLARNQAAALQRLVDLIDAAAQIPARRIATRPTLASQQRRIESKLRRGSGKAQRRERGFD